VSSDDHDERNLYGRGNSPDEERAREHASASVISSGAGVVGKLSLGGIALPPCFAVIWAVGKGGEDDGRTETTVWPLSVPRS